MNPKDSSDISLPIPLEGAPEGPRDFTGEFDDNYDTTTGGVSPEDPAYKPFPFAMRPTTIDDEEGIQIYFGVLVHQINRMTFNKDGLVTQTGVGNPQSIIPSPMAVSENRYDFYDITDDNGDKFRGDVYLAWETDPAGNVTQCEITGPDAPPSRGLPNDLGGQFYLKIGNVPEDGTPISTLDQNISSDVYWLTAFGIQEDGSDSDSSSSDSGSTSVSDSGSDKSTAIVPMDWHDGGYGALFTMESNEVLFEFVMRDVPLEGAKTVARIDDRFLAVCEPDSMTVTGVAGDRAGSVGAVVEENNVVLSAWPLSFLRPSKVTLKLTGVRKGFKHLDMPERSKEQFIANEKFINSAYPRG
jgi:hypothetical protein